MSNSTDRLVPPSGAFLPARLTRVIALAMVLVLAGCDGGAGDGSASRPAASDVGVPAGGERTVDGLRIVVAEDSVGMTNVGGQRIYYAVHTREQLRLIEWAPTIDERTPFIEPDETVSVRRHAAAGDSSEALVITWWRADSVGGRRVPSAPSSIEIAAPTGR